MTIMSVQSREERWGVTCALECVLGVSLMSVLLREYYEERRPCR
jgi:hypothetical protein